MLEKVDIDAPEGSYMGSLLFLIYNNDLPHAVQNSAVSMYADDTWLCYQASDIKTINEAINKDLIQLEIWFKGNKLFLNVAKPDSMLISTKQKQTMWNDLPARNKQTSSLAVFKELI